MKNRFYRVNELIAAKQGSAAMEFALVIPLFITLVLSIIGMTFLVYAMNALHYAAEDAARCFSVDKTVCANSAAAEVYAQSRYKGPGVSPIFVATLSGCGHTVTGTATFPLNAGLVNVAVPISASACFP